MRDNEEKENEKEQDFKTVKIRSPAISKGSKHFMAPTISAASKITAASPRKKVLADRNEPLRMSSVSFSEGKNLSCSMNLSDVMEDFDSKSEIGSNQKKMMEPSVDSKEMGLESPLIPKPPKLEEVIDSKVPSNSNGSESTVTDIDPNCVGGEFARFKISPSPSPSCSSCPILAPLDADPSVPPYDPKTNYLSPRPQFLHYRPNPRVGVYLNKESFIFESLSDTETTEETESEDSLKESEDDSSAEMVKEEEEKEPDDSESDSTSTQLSTQTVAAKGVSKKHFSLRSKSISLLLIVVVACLSISLTDTPVINGTSVFKDTSSKLNDPIFTMENFNGLARKFRFWSANSISYLTKLIQLPKEVEKLGALQFYNLTALQEDLFLDGYLMIDTSNELGEAYYEPNELGPIREVEVEISSLEEKGHTEIGAVENIVDVSDSFGSEIGEDNEFQEVLPEEHKDPETEEQVNLTLETEVTEDKNSEAEEMLIQVKRDIYLRSNAELEEHLSEVQPEVPEAKEIEEHVIYVDSCVETESIKAEEISDNSKSIATTNVISHSMETLASTVNSPEAKLSVPVILGISLLALSLVAATAFVYAKQRKSAVLNAAIPLKELPIMKVISSGEWKHQRQSPSLNWPTEVDIGSSESCPSEMSSFQKCSSYSKRAGNHEAQSLEKKTRRSLKRESLASSSDFSMDSPSYGSFTTYEIIHRKHVSI